MNTILCVDDLRANRILFKRLFTRNGYEVVDCPDASSALKMVSGGTTPAAIVLDLFLPRMYDGFEALRTFRAHTATGAIPVIVVSSHADEKMCDEAVRLGAARCVTRPSDERLVAALRAVVPPSGPSSN